MTANEAAAYLPLNIRSSTDPRKTLAARRRKLYDLVKTGWLRAYELPGRPARRSGDINPRHLIFNINDLNALIRPLSSDIGRASLIADQAIERLKQGRSLRNIQRF